MTAAPESLTADLAGMLAFPEDATLGTPGHEDAAVVKPWTEDDVLRLLWRHFASQSWACVPQVTVAMSDLNPEFAGLSAWAGRMRAIHEHDGTAAETYNDVADRRIDMLCLRRPPKRTDLGVHETLAIEVKVTRADFLQDVRNPAKQAAWRKAATRHAYAVPAGLVTADEVPEGSGLIAVKHAGTAGWGTAEWVKRAPYLPGHAPQLPPRVLLAVMFRIASLEGHTRGWGTGPEAAGDPQELRAALTAAHKGAERAEKARERAEGQRDAWKSAYALLAKDGHPCAWCGRPVKPLRPGPHGFASWRHRDQDDDAPCVLAETAELERTARQEYDEDDEKGRRYRLASAHRAGPSGFDEAAEREPWRAYLPYDYHRPRRLILRGPYPADVLPEGADL